jgi:hypothetical protein
MADHYFQQVVYHVSVFRPSRSSLTMIEIPYSALFRFGPVTKSLPRHHSVQGLESKRNMEKALPFFENDVDDARWCQRR